MRDTGHELTDGRQTLLPDHLPLQRLQRFPHPPLLAHLAVEHGARVVEPAQHQVEGVLQLGELARRHRPPLDGREIARADALRRGLQMRERVGEPARESERDDQPADEAEPENREAARPERRGAVDRQRHRDADADDPGSVLDARFAIHAADAVETNVIRGLTIAGRGTQLRRQQLADVALGVAAPGENAPIPIGDGNHRTFGNRNRGERILQRSQIDEEAERADDVLRAVANRIAEHDIAHA